MSASPVPVGKCDSSFRICGDDKVIVGPTFDVAEVADNNIYLFPKTEKTLVTLAEETFSKIDLATAYLQLGITDKFKHYTTKHSLRTLHLQHAPPCEHCAFHFPQHHRQYDKRPCCGLLR